MIEYYPLIKTIHVGSVILSFTLFFVRGFWMVYRPALLQRAWVKVVPHVIDTVLLTSAILLAITIAQYPGVHGWLTAKVIGLLAYIGLGTVALKRGPTRRVRIAAWICALLVFGYIVSVAVTHDVLPFRPYL